MKKAIIEYEGMTTVTELTIKGTTPLFDKLGIEYRILTAAEITKEDIAWCDLFFAIRPYCYDTYCNAKAAKDAGCFYYVHFDDDLLNWVEAYGERKEYAKKCLALADLVVSTSPLIAEEYSSYSETHRHIVSDTAIDPSELVTTEKDDKTHLVFAAGQNHEPIFNQFIEPVLDEILGKYNGNVDITFIGVHPELKNLKHKELVNYVKGMPLEEYNQYMRSHHFDIGLAPLEDSWFCNRKYYNKYLEYAKVGICGIFSNCLPYTYIIREGINGYLVGTTPEEWKKAICDCIDDTEKRDRIISYSQEQLKKEFYKEEIENKSLIEMPELLNYQRPDEDFTLNKSKVTRNIFMFKDRVYRAFYIWRHQGFKEMTDTVIRHVSK